MTTRIDLGPVRPRFAGPWAAGQAYRLNHLVTHNGSLWALQVAEPDVVTGAEPGVDPRWILAAQGLDPIVAQTTADNAAAAQQAERNAKASEQAAATSATTASTASADAVSAKNAANTSASNAASSASAAGTSAGQAASAAGNAASSATEAGRQAGLSKNEADRAELAKTGAETAKGQAEGVVTGFDAHAAELLADLLSLDVDAIEAFAARGL